MGKIELRFEVDEDTASALTASGREPAEVLQAGLATQPTANRWSFVESAREKAKDPEGAARRAREWAEENKAAIEEHNQAVARRGLLSDYPPFKPRWIT